MVSMLASSAIIDHEFEPRSGQTKDYEIGICCFSTEHHNKSRDWLARNRIMCPSGTTFFFSELVAL
jgi:hypothetical protein